MVSLGMYSFRGMKIGLDCANGAAWNIAKSVFDALGAETYVINAEPTGININNNAGSTHIENLQKFVVEKGLDAGFAYDGDADRCLCVDEKGNVVTGDHILYIYGRYMKERGTLITPSPYPCLSHTHTTVQGHLAMLIDILGCHHLGGRLVATVMSWAEATDVAKPLPVKDSLPTKNFLT